MVFFNSSRPEKEGPVKLIRLLAVRSNFVELKLIQEGFTRDGDVHWNKKSLSKYYKIVIGWGVPGLIEF